MEGKHNKNSPKFPGQVTWNAQHGRKRCLRNGRAYSLLRAFHGMYARAFTDREKHTHSRTIYSAFKKGNKRATNFKI